MKVERVATDLPQLLGDAADLVSLAAEQKG